MREMNETLLKISLEFTYKVAYSHLMKHCLNVFVYYAGSLATHCASSLGGTSYFFK